MGKIPHFPFIIPINPFLLSLFLYMYVYIMCVCVCVCV